MWCIPEVTSEFVSRMENILNLYEKPYNPKEPVICTDEKSKQLIADTRKTKAVKAERVRRRDYEYQRNGTRNIFMAVEPKAGFRKTKITKCRKKPDFAKFIKELTRLKRYQKADKIHLVLDNLNTHFGKSFYETFSQTEAQTVLDKIEFHYTPKHASWLNMAEIEISIMDKQCTKGRIASAELLTQNISAWQKNRNRRKAKINWKFTTQDARRKFQYQPAKLN